MILDNAFVEAIQFLFVPKMTVNYLQIVINPIFVAFLINLLMN